MAVGDMLTPDDADAIRWRVIFHYDDGEDEPPMAIECRGFEEAWTAALPADLSGWYISQKDRATAWFSIKFTRYRPFIVAFSDRARTEIQLLY